MDGEGVSCTAFLLVLLPSPFFACATCLAQVACFLNVCTPTGFRSRSHNAALCSLQRASSTIRYLDFTCALAHCLSSLAVPTLPKAKA